jgi:hypothetical protein
MIPLTIRRAGSKNALKLNTDNGEGRFGCLSKLIENDGEDVILEERYAVVHIAYREICEYYLQKKMTLSAYPLLE